MNGRIVMIDAHPQRCTMLDWDSHFWGFPVARMNESILNEESLGSALEWCGQRKVRCLYFPADGTDCNTLRLAGEAGFRFVDVRIDLEARLESEVSSDSVYSAIRVYRDLDLPELQSIARCAHSDTRFFKDMNFDRKRAAELYAHWIQRDAREHLVLVCNQSSPRSRIVGYVSCQSELSGVGRIGLIAVEKQARGEGVGKELVKAAIEFFARKSLLSVRVATQVSNVAAIRLYEGTGFKTCETRVWFHKWFPR